LKSPKIFETKTFVKFLISDIIMGFKILCLKIQTQIDESDSNVGLRPALVTIATIISTAFYRYVTVSPVSYLCMAVPAVHYW